MIVDHFNGGQIKWTAARLELVRQYAGEGNSAAVIAKRLGLGAGRGPAVAMVCKRNNIKLQGKAGRPTKADKQPEASMPVVVPAALSALVERFARRLEITPWELLNRLTAGLQKQGDTAIINMLLEGE